MRRIFVADEPCPRHVRQVAAPTTGMRTIEVDYVARLLTHEAEVAWRQIPMTNDLRRFGERRPGGRVVHRAHELNRCKQLAIFPATPLQIGWNPPVEVVKDLPSVSVDTT